MLMMYGQANWKVAEQIQADVEGLLIELSDLLAWNDELMSMKDHDQVVIRELSAQVEEYTDKYEQAKTELRSINGRAHGPRATVQLRSPSGRSLATTPILTVMM